MNSKLAALSVVFSIVLLLGVSITFEYAEATQSQGTKNSVTNSKEICGITFCDEQLTNEEKIKKYFYNTKDAKSSRGSVSQQQGGASIAPITGSTTTQAPATNPNVVTPDSYEGKEIQKMIDLLRDTSKTWNDNHNSDLDLLEEYAANIEKYLKEGKIILDPNMNPNHDGESREHEGPIYVNPGGFLPSGQNNGQGVDLNDGSTINMAQNFFNFIELMGTLIHEKQHSEHHTYLDRLLTALSPDTLVGDYVEIDAWLKEIYFYDEFAKILHDNCQSIPLTKLQEKQICLKQVHRIIEVKLSAITNYDELGVSTTPFNPDHKKEINDLDDQVVEEIDRLTLLLNPDREDFGAIIEEQEQQVAQTQGILANIDEFDSQLLATLENNMTQIGQTTTESKELVAHQSAKIASTLSGHSLDYAFDILLSVDVAGLDYLGDGSHDVSLFYPGTRDMEIFYFDISIAADDFVSIFQSQYPQSKIFELYEVGSLSLLSSLSYEIGEKITVLEIGGKYYPIDQFISAEPDLCPHIHYHAVGTSAVSLDGHTIYDESECGFGHPASIPVKQVFYNSEGTLTEVEEDTTTGTDTSTTGTGTSTTTGGTTVGGTTTRDTTTGGTTTRDPTDETPSTEDPPATTYGEEIDPDATYCGPDFTEAFLNELKDSWERAQNIPDDDVGAFDGLFFLKDNGGIMDLQGSSRATDANGELIDGCPTNTCKLGNSALLMTKEICGACVINHNTNEMLYGMMGSLVDVPFAAAVAGAQAHETFSYPGWDLEPASARASYALGYALDDAFEELGPDEWDVESFCTAITNTPQWTTMTSDPSLQACILQPDHCVVSKITSGFNNNNWNLENGVLDPSGNFIGSGSTGSSSSSSGTSSSGLGSDSSSTTGSDTNVATGTDTSTATGTTTVPQTKKYFIAFASTSAHAWVELYDGDTVYKRGLWAAGHKGTTPGAKLVHAGEEIDSSDRPPTPEEANIVANIFYGGNGAIKDEGKTQRGTSWVGFEITEEEYNKSVDYINGASTDYSVVSRNCVDFAIEVAEELDISLPTNNGTLYSDPEEFVKNLDKSGEIGDRNQFNGDWRSGPKWIQEQLQSSDTSQSSTMSDSNSQSSMSDSSSSSSSLGDLSPKKLKSSLGDLSLTKNLRTIFGGSTNFSDAQMSLFFENKLKSDVTVDFGSSRDPNAVLISNTGQNPIYSIILQNPSGTIVDPIVNGWTSSSSSRGDTIILTTEDNPIIPNQNLGLKLETSGSLDSLFWKVADENNSSLGFGFSTDNSETLTKINTNYNSGKANIFDTGSGKVLGIINWQTIWNTVESMERKILGSTDTKEKLSGAAIDLKQTKRTKLGENTLGQVSHDLFDESKHVIIKTPDIKKGNPVDTTEENIVSFIGKLFLNNWNTDKKYDAVPTEKISKSSENSMTKFLEIFNRFQQN